MSHYTITLAGETDAPGFRREARSLLAALVAPERVSWAVDDRARAERFSKAFGPAAPRAASGAGITHPLVPRSFMSLCEIVLLHKAPVRFELLYRLLWRLVHEPGLQADPLDVDRRQALHMAQAVRRDMQKMKALVHFSVIDEPADTEALHLAWFDPAHHIVEAVAPSFARRLAPLRWAILTPERSVRWDGHLLEFGPGAPRPAPAEAFDSYLDIFQMTSDRTALRSDRDSAAGQRSRLGSAP